MQITANIARKLTYCHVPFRGIFSLEKHFPFRQLVRLATRSYPLLGRCRKSLGNKSPSNGALPRFNNGSRWITTLLEVHASNNDYELGSLTKTETPYCVNTKKALVDAVLDKLILYQRSKMNTIPPVVLSKNIDRKLGTFLGRLPKDQQLLIKQKRHSFSTNAQSDGLGFDNAHRGITQKGA